MKEVANGHADNEAGRLVASLAQARRRSERAERDRRLEKLAVEVERLASPTWFRRSISTLRKSRSSRGSPSLPCLHLRTGAVRSGLLPPARETRYSRRRRLRDVLIGY
jgi:hypothetical protein